MEQYKREPHNSENPKTQNSEKGDLGSNTIIVLNEKLFENLILKNLSKFS